jgi:hypothetical protein
LTKSRRQLRLLLPTADKIALACGVDQERATKIQAQLGNLLEFVVDIIADQAELVKGQSDTIKLVEKQLGRERDAGMIREDTLRFLSGDPVPVEHVLKMVFTDFYRNEFVKLEHEIKIELFAILSKAINSLKQEAD